MKGVHVSTMGAQTNVNRRLSKERVFLAIPTMVGKVEELNFAPISIATTVTIAYIIKNNITRISYIVVVPACCHPEVTFL